MDWPNERYVRIYTRDSLEWLALSWHARGLACLLLRKVDRAGIIELGRIGLKGIAVLLQAPWADIDGPLQELLDDGCFEVRGAYLIAPNFIEAQEARASGAERTRTYRERLRDIARAQGVISDATSQHEGNAVSQDGDDTSQDVTRVTEPVTDVTPSRTVPCLAVPSCTKPATPAKRACAPVAGVVPEVGVGVGVGKPGGGSICPGEVDPAEAILGAFFRQLPEVPTTPRRELADWTAARIPEELSLEHALRAVELVAEANVGEQRPVSEQIRHFKALIKKPAAWWQDRETEQRPPPPPPKRKPEPSGPEPTAEERAAHHQSAVAAREAFAKVGQPPGQLATKPGNGKPTLEQAAEAARAAQRHAEELREPCERCGKTSHTTKQHDDFPELAKVVS